MVDPRRIVAHFSPHRDVLCRPMNFVHQRGSCPDRSDRRLDTRCCTELLSLLPAAVTSSVEKSHPAAAKSKESFRESIASATDNRGEKDN